MLAILFHSLLDSLWVQVRSTSIHMCSVYDVRTDFECINCCLAIILHNLQLSFSFDLFRSIYSNKYGARHSSFICDDSVRKAQNVKLIYMVYRYCKNGFPRKWVEKAEQNRVFSISFKFKIDERTHTHTQTENKRWRSGTLHRLRWMGGEKQHFHRLNEPICMGVCSFFFLLFVAPKKIAINKYVFGVSSCIFWWQQNLCNEKQ